MTIIRNRVLLVLGRDRPGRGAGTSPILTHAPNRLLSGQPIAALDLSGPWGPAVIAAAALLLAGAFAAPSRPVLAGQALFGIGLAVALIWPGRRPGHGAGRRRPALGPYIAGRRILAAGADRPAGRGRCRPPPIEFDHVSKVFDGITAVDDLTLTIPQGAFCALIGSSGSGKSTSMRMINRLIPHSSGSIRLDGEDVENIPVETLRRRMGYAIQSIGLFPHWTVARNIAAVPTLLGWPQARIDERVQALLALLKLDPRFASKYPHQLSGGQQQRVGVARALAADPEVLLMELSRSARWTSITRDALQAEMARIHRETGKTIVFVTHDMDEALRLATQIAILDRGRLIQLGSPREILTAPANDFVRDFIGRDDLGLKLLAIETAAHRVRPGETAEGAPIPGEASLRTALSILVARNTDRAPVTAADGKPLGALYLDDLVRV